MADFVKEHKKNVRFSVNRSEKLFLKVSQCEKDNWNELVTALQERRNTGTQIDTFLYLVKKHATQKQIIAGLIRNGRFAVGRDKGILFKLSVEELKDWKAKVAAHGGSQVECFVDMLNTEYTFQDNIEVITQ